LARTGKNRKEIKRFIVDQFGYDLDRTIDEIRPVYEFNESCQGSVPEAIIAFLESTGFENAVRLAVSIGGDSDTIAAITGGIAEAFYQEIPRDIADFVQVILGPDLMNDVVIPFSEKYGCKRMTDSSTEPTPPPPIINVKKSLKSQAIKIVNQKCGLRLKNSNTMFSSINMNVPQWSINRDNDHFDDDTHVILLDQYDKKLHYFFIKAGTIKNPAKMFPQRTDRHNWSIITIPTLAYNFKEQHTEFPFGDYKVVTIPYKEANNGCQ
jgi:hypothetical protein